MTAATTPCPTWCGEPADHDTEPDHLAPAMEPIRRHRVVVSTTSTCIVEIAALEDSEDSFPPEIEIEVLINGRVVFALAGAEEARRFYADLAPALEDAAQRLEAIMAVGA